MPSTALGVFGSNLTRVDHVLSFHDKKQNPKVGPPPGPDRSLVLGAITLVYASWEAYIEQVGVEVVEFLADRLEPAKVPQSVRDQLTAEAEPWALAGEGWRKEWKELVERHALGDGSADFGLNTAGPRQVIKLYRIVGLDPFLNVKWQNRTVNSVKQSLAALIRLRGQVVHTANVPSGVGLTRAEKDKDFIDRLAGHVDQTLCDQATELAGIAPW